MRLDDAVAALPAQDLLEARVDVSRWFPDCPEFVYREPSIRQLYMARADAEQMRARFTDWPQELAMTVALLACCHVSPESRRPVGVLYCEMAEKRGDLILWLASELMRQMPHLGNLGAAAEQAKNA